MTLRSTLPNRCKQCKVRMPADKAHHFIHSDCVDAWYAVLREKQAIARVKAAKVLAAKERKADAATRLSQKSRSKWLTEAKTAIQQTRRLEELAKGRGCMSCKRTQQEVEAGDWRPGGYWDGGHFKSKGAHPELSLEPLNIWLQCKSCNAGSGKYARKGHTVNANFETNLIEAEGQALVDWLNGPHPLKHYKIDELIAIKSENAVKTKALKCV